MSTSIPLSSLSGRVVVITGGAGGIGRAIAERAASEGARLMLGDIEPESLEKAVASFREQGVEVEGALVDVSKRASVEDFADTTFARFGEAHLVVNNAGVSPRPAPCWADDDDDWRWVMDVNLEGVRSGIRAFVPRMLEAKTPGHVVNIASLAGLTSIPSLSSYVVSKHAVVALSEVLFHDLAQARAPIGVSVVCPSFVKTRIHESGRNRPHAQDEDDAKPKDDGSVDASSHPVAQQVARWIDRSPPPSIIADAVVDAVEANAFWVLPQENVAPAFQARADALLAGKPPASALG